MIYRVGIDVGGTFTDLALLADDGRLHVFKVPSRPADIAGGCLDGLAGLIDQAGVAPTEITYWSHGSTVATNAVVERKGALMALLVTEGFRDILEIRRQIKPDRYDLHRMKPEPLVPRDRRLEVRERILWDGSIHAGLDETSVDRVLDHLDRLRPEAVAICFLHAYTNPVHEQAVVGEVRRRLPGTYVAVSHEVLPEFREYPRCATTVTNAYVGPVMERYLERFAEGGRALGIQPPLTIFQSNGGIASASAAARLPVRVLYSGPAAGVRGAVHVAAQAGYQDVITFDMGGTSCDVCLARGGAPLLTMEQELAGFPVRSPMIDVHSIGAGGGSIAWVDSGGLLQVGPQSAGADPGPACYGSGGTAATVTDAHLVLGRLNPESLLGGRLTVHRDRAHTALAALSDALHRSVEEGALGILDVVNSNMIGAIRVVSVERGYDYRDCTLVAFGGAGPLHAAEIAREMGIRTVLIPRAPGILCALGLLLADYRSDFTQTRILPAAGDRWREMREVFSGLEARAQQWSVEHGIPIADATWYRSIYMRYIGQSYQLPVLAPSLENPSAVSALVETFHGVHRAAYGFDQPEANVESVDFHLTLIVPVPRPEIAPAWVTVRTATLADARLGERLVWLKSGRDPVPTPVFRRDLLPLECTLRGPAILEQLDSTTVVPPDSTVQVDRWGTLHMTLL